MMTRDERRAFLERADILPPRKKPPHPIARMLRECAKRIDAGERWRDALSDYGLVLLPTPENRQRAVAPEAPSSEPKPSKSIVGTEEA